jgi:hypothetical protein
MTANIKAVIKRRNELAATGRIKKVTKSILGVPKRSSVIDVIEDPAGPITDQAKIHSHLTKAWKKKFRHPANSVPYLLGLEGAPRPDNPQPSSGKWEDFLQDLEAMKEFFHKDPHVQMSAHMVKIIVDAFASTPGRGTAEEDIAQAMTKPFMLDEVRAIIKKHTNTALELINIDTRASPR